MSHSAVPKAMTLTEIGDASANDPELTRLHQCIQSGQWRQCDKEYIKLEHELTKCGDVILRGSRIIIPTALRQRVIQIAHEGHPGIVRTKQRLRGKVWWPGIDKQTKLFVQSCHA